MRFFLLLALSLFLLCASGCRSSPNAADFPAGTLVLSKSNHAGRGIVEKYDPRHTFTASDWEHCPDDEDSCPAALVQGDAGTGWVPIARLDRPFQ